MMTFRKACASPVFLHPSLISRLFLVEKENESRFFDRIIRLCLAITLCTFQLGDMFIFTADIKISL